ncbi:nitroreductase [Allosphingosinicella flava]|uniref:Putative NAD(P)H nitroreductase n=1 Tax=Allosphingosinicella flava TaxID=2771430 RepID=A0A7T2GJS3_9SPHN|nr:nitroreductase [Sphingosinicella flava]QPQ55131.1 nitroreductase [Sphingosinicella flava]
MLNDFSTPLSLLKTRRSARPRDLVAPGPNAAELREIFEIAARTPDHGKLHPWRFVHVPKTARPAFENLLLTAYRAANPEPGRLEIEAVERFANQAPELIVVLYSPVDSARIPPWEQELSCGAACMNLLSAAHALGYAGGWVTGWAASSPAVLKAFAQAEDERIAGFFFLGTPGVPLEERPRPDRDEVVSEWRG